MSQNLYLVVYSFGITPILTKIDLHKILHLREHHKGSQIQNKGKSDNFSQYRYNKSPLDVGGLLITWTERKKNEAKVPAP